LLQVLPMSGVLLALAALGLLLLPLIVALSRSTQVFVLQVRAGQTRFIRGRILQPLFDQICDIVAANTPTGSLIVIRESGRPRLIAKGSFSAGQLQQLRNVVGLYPLAKLLAGGRPRKG
jgi:hypothetical protein